ncbi:MAG: hypothetical protein JNM56_06000 [Planctomycetia bacterium]|nr:hypothetical protein [Planctomycetia bacterium]
MPLQSARVEFRADPDWLAEVRAVAERLSLNVSAFVRMTVTQALERQREPPRLPLATVSTNDRLAASNPS